MWSGAYQCWGKENKEAPLRTTSPPGVLNGVVSNFEIKEFDGCANPHLGLAAIIVVGIDGLRRHLSLPEPIDLALFLYSLFFLIFIFFSNLSSATAQLVDDPNTTATVDKEAEDRECHARDLKVGLDAQRSGQG
ncbi:Type-1 glutamine synthetase 1 [Camellia lanceoleosa]|uniref:Type-1 glutamine synthetase 1 n=1 Tax=Camellia lanceoleosa TaxID=1840588 RepID=A0ACC0IZX8_9ERIC|nr:Type-1 glutamine synthetase 1 [Camellia lanceoleosa]